MYRVFCCPHLDKKSVYTAWNVFFDNFSSITTISTAATYNYIAIQLSEVYIHYKTCISWQPWVPVMRKWFHQLLIQCHVPTQQSTLVRVLVPWLIILLIGWHALCKWHMTLLPLKKESNKEISSVVVPLNLHIQAEIRGNGVFTKLEGARLV